VLVRVTDGGLTLIPQAAHAILSGRLARHWPGLDRVPAHDWLQWAIGLHDLPWQAEDATPRRGDDGALVDFLTLPRELKEPLYVRGINTLEALHPYLAIVVSMHYTHFVGTRKWQSLQDHEQARRKRLARQLPSTLADPVLWRQHLAWLQFFDNLSLLLCLTGPDTTPDGPPHWMTPKLIAQQPDDTPCRLVWASPGEVQLAPQPHPAAFDYVCKHFRTHDPQTVHDRWADTPWSRHGITVVADDV